jgi:hypothetical protein
VAVGGNAPSPAGWIITTARNRAIDLQGEEETRHGACIDLVYADAAVAARMRSAYVDREGPVRAKAPQTTRRSSWI